MFLSPTSSGIPPEEKIRAKYDPVDARYLYILGEAASLDPGTRIS